MFLFVGDVSLTNLLLRENKKLVLMYGRIKKQNWMYWISYIQFRPIRQTIANTSPNSYGNLKSLRYMWLNINLGVSKDSIRMIRLSK